MPILPRKHSRRARQAEQITIKQLAVSYSQLLALAPLGLARRVVTIFCFAVYLFVVVVVIVKCYVYVGRVWYSQMIY